MRRTFPSCLVYQWSPVKVQFCESLKFTFAKIINDNFETSPRIEQNNICIFSPYQLTKFLLQFRTWLWGFIKSLKLFYSEDQMTSELFNNINIFAYSIPCSSSHFLTLSCSAWYFTSMFWIIFINRFSLFMLSNNGSYLIRVIHHFGKKSSLLNSLRFWYAFPYLLKKHSGCQIILSIFWSCKSLPNLILSVQYLICSLK